VTYLGENLLPKTDVVVRGEAAAPMVLPTGAHVLRFAVKEVLAGTEAGKTLLVVAGSPDLLPPEGSVAILFLKRLGRGRYEPMGLIDTMGRDAKARISTLRKYLAIEIMTGAAEKRIALRDFLLTNLESKDEFLRWSAARELANFTRRNGAYLKAPHLARIRAARSRGKAKAFLSLLDTSLAQAGAPPEPARKKASAVDGGPAGPEYRELRRLFERWKKVPVKAVERLDILRRATATWLRHSAPLLLDALDDEDASVRRMAALQLGEGEFTSAEPALRKRLSEERDRDVLSALIHSLGLLKSQKALPSILAQGKAADQVRGAAFAAARIGGDLANEWLDGLLATYNRETEADRSIRRLVAFLRSEAFTRQEKALAEIRKRRLR